MADLSTINTDISSNFSNINFSYPEVDIDESKKNGYLDLLGNSTYLHFNYTRIIIDETNKRLCVEHTSPDKKTAYIVFNYVKGTNYDKLYNKPYIHLNHHIANEILEGSTLKYDSAGFYILGNGAANAATEFLIYFKDTTLKLNITDIPIKIEEEIKVPTDTNIGSATKLFKRGMFINDEVDCGESTIGSETIAKNKYATTVAGNLGIGIGGGITIICIVIAIITSNKDKLMFVNGTRLFGGWSGQGSHPVYNICWLIFLLSSIASFLAYGTGMLKNRGYNIDNERKDKTKFLSVWLFIAIITLILFIFMIGYKGLVLTLPAGAAGV